MAQPNSGSLRQMPQGVSYSSQNLRPGSYQTLPGKMSPDLYRSYISPQSSSSHINQLSGSGPRLREDPAAHIPQPAVIPFDNIQIPEVDKLTDEQINAMLADEEKLEGFVVTLPALVNNHPAAERCKKLAEEVEKQAARVAELRAQVEAKREEALAARSRLDDLRTKRREFEGMFSSSNVVAALQECENDADTASYELTQKLKHEEITPEQFVKEYMKCRTEYCMLRLKVESIDPESAML